MQASGRGTLDRLNVLLVDDHGLVRAGIAALIRLSIPGANIREAAGAQAAWTLLSEMPMDLVFLDLDLAGPTSGIELLQRIRGADMFTRIVMLSATTDADTVMACLRAGASGYLPKAVEDSGALHQAIECTLAGGVYLPPTVQDRQAVSSTAAMADPLAGLSPRLLEVLSCVCKGLPNKLIARQLGISEGTVRKTYMTELLRHFGVARRTALMYEVARRGIRMPHGPYEFQGVNRP